MSSQAVDLVDPLSYEEQNVHSVYESIASHFSSTRYKPWPIVETFLKSLEPGAVGLDVGCGNGKYLGVSRDVFIVGSDRSASLVGIAGGVSKEGGKSARNARSGRKGGEKIEDGGRNERNEVVVADTLALPHQAGRFDFVISIAVVHHLSTRERRREAIKGILKCLRVGGQGKALVYVWALEQKGSRRGWDEGCEQDVMVPWVMKGKKNADGDDGGDGGGEKTFQRYYHLYRKGELEEDVIAVGGKVLESGYERDNWWVICGT